MLDTTVAGAAPRAARSTADCANTRAHASSSACTHSSAPSMMIGRIPTNSSVDCALSRTQCGGVGRGVGGEVGHARGITRLLSLMQVNYGKREIVKRV